MKNILFLVTGMTPQIVTETLWALACDPNNSDKWIPDEIQVLSTEYGLNQIQKRLFEDGVFTQMQTDYPQLQSVVFNQESLSVIENNHKKLSDIKTPSDNEALANAVCKKICALTQNDNVSLHVSIAGGRKTMGVYTGYALSLYGRSQDRLSHVLVEENFEGAKKFFYPTPKSYYISNRNYDVFDAKDAKIWLADIPFVRMRNLIDNKSIMRTKSFSEVVKLIDMSIQPITLNIIDETQKSHSHNVRTIMINDIKCKLSAKEFAVYMLFVKLKQSDKSLKYPVKDAKDYIDKETLSLYNETYFIHKKRVKLEDKKFDHDYLRDALTNIRRKFRQTFGKSVTDKIMICETEQQGYYAIPLEKGQIIIQK